MQICTRPKKDLSICPVIVLRDLDHYCFGIQLVVLEILVELFEFQCIGYVTLIKRFINQRQKAFL